jgi:hypothetical protein
LIDPADLARETKVPASVTHMNALKDAHDFHEKLKLHFHQPTYAHYGADRKHESFGAIYWEASETLPNALRTALPKAKASQWTLKGQATLDVEGRSFRMTLANKRTPETDDDEDAGDGTVPYHSARLVQGCELSAVFHLRGFPHPESYGNENVLENVPWCIGRLVQLATPVKDLPHSKDGSSWLGCSNTNGPLSASAPLQEHS